MNDTRHILLVDGNQTSKRGIATFFENRGFHVTPAHDMLDALVKSDSGNFMVTVASAETPGLPVSDFVYQSREKKSELPVIVFGKNISVAEAVNVMRSGAADVLTGDVEIEQLSAAVESVLEKLDSNEKNKKKGKHRRIITRNIEMIRLLSLVDQVADSTASVLIKGESGTGKELFARYIHEKSKRSKGPFVAVNCAALPENLLESELFGHEKGAFTGAISRKSGKFELADKGTILLDEITEMQLHLQSKLLRIIQEKEIDRVGGGNPVSVDVRIVATTNRNIMEWVEKGNFREDLYYRLNVIPLSIPPLRQRLDDVEQLCDHFIMKFNDLDGRNVKSLTKEALDRIKQQPLRGNVRELENIIQRAVLLASGDYITPDALFLDGSFKSPVVEKDEKQAEIPDDFLSSPLREVEKKMIFHTLDKTGWNRTHAATLLGISVRTLRNKLNEYKEGEEEVSDDE